MFLMAGNASRPGSVALPATFAHQKQGSNLLDHLFTMIGLVPRSALFWNHDIIQFNSNAVVSQNQPPMPTITVSLHVWQQAIETKHAHLKMANFSPELRVFAFSREDGPRWCIAGPHDDEKANHPCVSFFTRF